MTEQYEYEASLTASERCDVPDAEYRSWGRDIWLQKRKHQNGELARLWQPESVQIVTASKCNIKHNRQNSCSTVGLSCHPIQLRKREDAWEELSRWALVLPPNTVKIRGGCSIFLTTQLRQGEDDWPSVKLTSYHPMQSRQGEDARPSIMDTGKSICRLWG